MPAPISHQPPTTAAPGHTLATDAGEICGLVEQVTVLDASPVFVRINVRDTQLCSQCAMKSGCGHQLLSEAISGQRKNQTLQLPLPLGLQGNVHSGDMLDLVINESRLMSFSCLQYVVPILCMLLGTAVAGGLAAVTGAGEGWVIAAALVALGAGMGAVRVITTGMPLPVTLTIHTAESAGNSGV